MSYSLSEMIKIKHMHIWHIRGAYQKFPECIRHFVSMEFVNKIWYASTFNSFEFKSEVWITMVDYLHCYGCYDNTTLWGLEQHFILSVCPFSYFRTPKNQYECILINLSLLLLHVTFYSNWTQPVWHKIEFIRVVKSS